MMVAYLDEYFSRFTVLEQPERGIHALHFDGMNMLLNRDAVIAEFKERLAGYYPAYIIEYKEKYVGPLRVYIEARMRPIPKKRGDLDLLI